MRLRRRDRRRPAAPDHLRHDGHPARPTTGGLRQDERRPRRQRPRVRRHSSPTAFTAGYELWTYAQELARRSRSTNPRDDITTQIAHAEVDGERPHAGGVRLVLRAARRGRQRDDPQRDQPRHEGAHRPPRPAQALAGRLRGRRADRRRGDRALGDAGDPLPAHRDADTEIGGAADRARATRSCSGTTRPTATRPSSTTRTASTSAATPNEHVGFGGGGPHFCLGAHLARREITVMFEELFRRLPDIEVTGEPDDAAARTSSTASSGCPWRQPVKLRVVKPVSCMTGTGSGGSRS